MNREKTTEQLRSKILKLVFFIFIIFSFVLIYLVYIEQKNSLENFQVTTNEYIDKTVNYIFEQTADRYTFIGKEFIKDLDIVNYVKQEDREGLYRVLKPHFEKLKQQNRYFDTLHFIKADGSSFLRVHKKDSYGDPIIKNRPMVQEMMKRKTILTGYETGVYATVYRVLLPMFYKGEFIGSLGFGIEGNYFIEEIVKAINYQGALFIKDDQLQLYKHHKKFDLSINEFRLQTKLDQYIYNILQSLPKGFSFEDNYLFEKNNSKYLIHSKDINDFKGDINGKLVFVNNITKDIAKVKNTQLNIVLTMLLFLAVVFIAIRFTIVKFETQLGEFYKKIIAKIKAKENYLRAIEDNSSNIITTSSLEMKLVDANRRFFEFSGFKDLEAFRDKYECICDLFTPKKGYLQKEMDGLSWIEYIFQNPKKTHKAILLKDNKEQIFKVTSSKVKLDGKEVLVSTFADITEIEEIKNRLSFAINGTKDGLWDWDLQTDEVYFSPRWKGMLGFEPDEIPSSLKTWETKVHPDDLEKAVADIKANQNKQTDTYENIHRLRHKDGSWVWILDRGQTIFDDNGKALRMVGFHTDITKRKEEEQLIKLQAQRAEALLKIPKLSEELDEREFVQKGQEIAEDLTNSKIAFIHFVLEDEQNIELVAWSKRTLEDYCEVDLDTYGTHYPSHQAGIWANAMRTKKPFIVNDYPNFAEKMGLPKGHAHLQRFISVPVIENGKVVMITGVGNKKEDYNSLDVETVQLISNDIWQAVQRKRNLEEIKQKDKMMLTQSRNAAMGEMISMIAHQWRQPLAVVSMGANNLLADIELDMVEEESLRTTCKEILHQTAELSKTIDDFKEFFKPVKKFELTTVATVLDSAFKIVGKSLENNNIELIQTIKTEQEIETYSRELMQVFLNIINNAKEVLIEKKLPQKRITILIDEIDGGIIVKICDNGGGIPMEIYDKIFEPYFSTKDERTGTGLGLYMSKIIIEKHLGGVLSVVNQKDGACFIIELPKTLPQSSKKEDSIDG